MKLRNVKTGAEIELSDKQAHINRLARMRRRVSAWVKAIDEVYDLELHRMVMIRLSYAPEFTWAKNHVRDYLQALRRYVKENLLGYAWVAELQKRGEVHYHLYLIVNQGTDVPKPDDSGMWPWGSSRIETGRSPFYLISYLKKEYQKRDEFPKGLRIFAVWIQKDLLNRAQDWRFRISSLPAWLRESLIDKCYAFEAYPKKYKEGYWVAPVTEEVRHLFSLPYGAKVVFSSPWEMVGGGRKRRSYEEIEREEILRWFL